jgi:hypothetical protein
LSFLSISQPRLHVGTPISTECPEFQTSYQRAFKLTRFLGVTSSSTAVFISFAFNLVLILVSSRLLLNRVLPPTVHFT